jgi:hypothetical protein
MDEKIRSKEFFRTKDISEASFLYASDKKLIELEKSGYFFYFVFEDVSGCMALIQSFWRKEAMIDAKTYADAFRSLKDRLFCLLKEGR